MGRWLAHGAKLGADTRDMAYIKGTFGKHLTDETAINTVANNVKARDCRELVTASALSTSQFPTSCWATPVSRNRTVRHSRYSITAFSRAADNPCVFSTSSACPRRGS